MSNNESDRYVEEAKMICGDPPKDTVQFYILKTVLRINGEGCAKVRDCIPKPPQSTQGGSRDDVIIQSGNRKLRFPQWAQGIVIGIVCGLLVIGAFYVSLKITPDKSDTPQPKPLVTATK
jgi:hypothetical protein